MRKAPSEEEQYGRIRASPAGLAVQPLVVLISSTSLTSRNAGGASVCPALLTILEMIS